ncbi:hypothetical protein EDD16DRAFT_1475576, partial [Pisolithus croceorrhizus]
LFIYDYALTFSKEIDLFWFQPRRTWAFAFFIANRYIGLFSRIPTFFLFFLPMAGGPVRENSYMCSDLQLFNSIAILVLQLIGGMIMIARVYAFYNQDRRILSLLVAVAMICVGISGVSETANLFTGPGHGVMHSGNFHFIHRLRLHQSQLQQLRAHIRSVVSW